jgi:hypothetical protein
MPDRDKKSNMSEKGKIGHSKEGQQSQHGGLDRGSDRERDEQGRFIDESDRDNIGGSNRNSSNR